MTSAETLPTHMISEEPHFLDMCPHLRESRNTAPVRQVRTLTGDKAWLVTGQNEVKQLFLDERCGRSHPDPENMPKVIGAGSGFDFVLSDDHDRADEGHAMLRRLLKPQFAAKHMEPLRPRVEALVDELLTAIISHGPPADLHAELSIPLVLESMWELLGVPVDDRSQWTTVMSSTGDAVETEITDKIAKLVGRKREAPGDDLVSRLCKADDSDEIVQQFVWTVLIAGSGSTVKVIDYGVLLLTQNPDQRDALMRDPALMPKTVEEVLRVSGGISLPRFARQDIEIGNVTIRTNELVLLDLTLANLDDHAFEHPERFDLTRSPNRHLSFAYGMTSCLGAPFARLVMHTAFSTLFTRHPTVRPAVPVEELRKNSDARLMGLAELPVTW